MPNQKLKLLVVDDDDLILQSIRLALPENWLMLGVKSQSEVPKDFFHAAFVDMHLTGDITKPEGLKVVKHLAKEYGNLEIVAISGNLDRDLMEDCLKAGASRFLAKPLTTEEIHLLLEKIEYHILLNNATQRSAISHIPWVGNSKPSNEIKRLIAELAHEAGPILIEGDSGTGKEVVAKLLHHPHAHRPFISVNVAALPENVFESEVFGHLKGSFTGADQNKMGLAEAANGGDLFLDEVEALPLALQPKLLRFLESGEIRRVGSKDSIKVNTRVIAATNQNLEQLVREGKFREDLMWRLNGKKLNLPPLRDRKEDVGDLTKHFFENEKPKRNKMLSPEAIERLEAYDWPGNVRELKRVCEQLTFSSPLPIIRAEDVETILKVKANNSPTEQINLQLGLSTLVNQYEKKVIEKAFESDKDIDSVAKTLGISRSSLYKKISDYSIEVKR